MINHMKYKIMQWLKRLLVLSLAVAIVISLCSCSFFGKNEEKTKMDLIQELSQMGYEKQATMLQSLEKNSIVMTTSKSEEKDFIMGESKIGGCPHLPENFEWPHFNAKSLAFLAQINLEQIVLYDTEKLLPETGILYFFHEGGEEVWGFDPKDKGGFKVVHYTGSISKLTLTPLPNDLEDYMMFSPCKVNFEITKSYPSELYELERQLFGSEDSDSHDDFYDKIYEYSGGNINKLFGYPDLIQGDIFLESQLVTNGLYCGDQTGYMDPRAKELEKGVSDWILLFQVDSDDNAGMMWGDVGRIYFNIKKDDLKNCNFDNIWSAFQCG